MNSPVCFALSGIGRIFTICCLLCLQHSTSNKQQQTCAAVSVAVAQMATMLAMRQPCCSMPPPSPPQPPCSSRPHHATTTVGTGANASAPLFSIADAPTSVGRVSFSVSATTTTTSPPPSRADVAAAGFDYAVNVVVPTARTRDAAAPSYSDVPWVVRYPQPTTSGSEGSKLTASCESGCEVVATDPVLGMVRVHATAPHFVVRGVYD